MSRNSNLPEAKGFEIPSAGPADALEQRNLSAGAKSFLGAYTINFPARYIFALIACSLLAMWIVALGQQFTPVTGGEMSTKVEAAEASADFWHSALHGMSLTALSIGLVLAIGVAFWSYRRIQPFRAALAEAAIGLAVANRDGHFVLVNPAFCRLLGYTTEELRSRDWITLTHPDDRAKNAALLSRMRAGGLDNSLVEQRYITKLGKVVWARNRVCVVRDRFGTPTNFISFVEDITERKQAEARLQESGSRFRAIFQNAGVGITEIGPDGALRMANAAFCHMLGYAESELVQKTWEELTHPQDRARERNLLQAMQAGETDSCEVEKRYLHRNGSVIWVIATYSAGETSSYWIAISQDITERKRLEEDKLRLLGDERLAKAEAVATKRELMEILERISDGFFVLDRDWRYRYINEKGAQYLGYPREELLGKNMWARFPEAASEPLYQLYQKALQEQVPASYELYFEPWEKWFDVRIYPSTDGLSIMFHDTTERRQSQEELRHTLERMRALSDRLQKAREDERKQVARDLHDQIGQILTAVKMDVDWVQKHISPGGDGVRARLQSTVNLVRDATQLVRRICTDLRPAVLDDLGLGAAIEWQANEFAARTGIRCEISVPPEDLDLNPDSATAIFRILQEALTNVARHADAKSVRVSLVRRHARLLLIVEDDGKGILESDLARHKGSLGLLGMKERAEACSGEMHIWGEPGLGTTVAVEIPMHGPEEKDKSNAHLVSG